MKRLTTLLLMMLALAVPSLASAGSGLAGSRTVSTERWVEEWDHATQSWVRVTDDDAAAWLDQVAMHTAHTTKTTHSVNGIVTTLTTTLVREPARYQTPLASRDVSKALASYGPFLVLDDRRAAIVGATDAAAPLHFDAMLRDFPELGRLDMIEAPGTSHDIANLELGRRIRDAGLATHVPAGGSVRSGAVELFLAGAKRTMDDRAEFAVHSWRDIYGREPHDFPEDAPENRLYLDYYEEMGMSEGRARDFYAMTNSVPHHGALWLNGGQMREWVRDNKEQRKLDRLAGEPIDIVVPDMTIERVDVQLSASQIAEFALL
ncbi:hypothetical protein [Erythrobacter sp. YT30]|uniref:hypothetical protein n=1 Tax=Erythrobacter sp. YT30 TaxID=1735012 RepID=UPI00076D5F28|nr:hypothetical protein [Erythrobacter sp. YT30]KWV91136.1 hypothetical protein AUC45_07425 [Erythrobacter sp. YT30]